MCVEALDVGRLDCARSIVAAANAYTNAVFSLSESILLTASCTSSSVMMGLNGYTKCIYSGIRLSKYEVETGDKAGARSTFDDDSILCFEITSPRRSACFRDRASRLSVYVQTRPMCSHCWHRCWPLQRTFLRPHASHALCTRGRGWSSMVLRRRYASI